MKDKEQSKKNLYMPFEIFNTLDLRKALITNKKCSCGGLFVFSPIDMYLYCISCYRKIIVSDFEKDNKLRNHVRNRLLKSFNLGVSEDARD